MSDSEQDSGEKEFEATEQRLQQARQDGNIPQSKEANGFAVIIGVVIATVLLTTVIGDALFNRFKSLFYHADAFANDAFAAKGQRTHEWLHEIALLIVPLFAVLAASVLLMLILTQSIAVSGKKIKPDAKKLSPSENLKKKYGRSGLIDFAKDTAKMMFAGLIASVFLYQFVTDYYGSSAIQMGNITQFTFGQILKLILYFGLFQFVLAAIDYPVQKQLHLSKLKMSREEMKKEVKQSEGDPYVKQSRREKASQISNGQMLQNVKASTVIMVNPEHYAVALKWEPESGNAPICVAKGVDHLAAKIREVAKENNIPIHRDPPSTRAIYRSVDVDQEILPEHFAAVAAAIQYVNVVSAREN